jgi:23S rRNA pseudouridine1911/1915/1917 synthase
VIREEIPGALDGERLDRVVALVTGASRADAATLVAAGAVSVDGLPAPSGKVRLRTGQVVAIDESQIPSVPLPQPDPGVDVVVVHADDVVIVVDKPAGLVVHPGAGNTDGTLVNGLLARFPELAGVGEAHRPGIVHRIDAGTSGLLVVARTPAAYEALVAAMTVHAVDRVSRTLVWGHPAHRTGVVDAPVGRDQRDPLKMAVVADGRPARTAYRVLAELADPVEVASLECRLETGRTHQIRVHLASIGHPVVGDATYGGARHGLTVPRPFLHAAELGFDHPVTGEHLSFTSPLPGDLTAILATLT